MLHKAYQNSIPDDTPNIVGHIKQKVIIQSMGIHLVTVWSNRGKSKQVRKPAVPNSIKQMGLPKELIGGFIN